MDSSGDFLGRGGGGLAAILAAVRSGSNRFANVFVPPDAAQRAAIRGVVRC
jgi:hypothetical protein